MKTVKNVLFISDSSVSGSSISYLKDKFSFSLQILSFKDVLAAPFEAYDSIIVDLNIFKSYASFDEELSLFNKKKHFWTHLENKDVANFLDSRIPHVFKLVQKLKSKNIKNNLFVLNNFFNRSVQFFLQELFDLKAFKFVKDEYSIYKKSDDILEDCKGIPSLIDVNVENQKFLNFMFFKFSLTSSNDNLEILGKIKNSKKIIAFKIKNKNQYLIPFYHLDNHCLEYINKILEKYKNDNLSYSQLYQRTVAEYWKKSYEIKELKEIIKKINVTEKEIETQQNYLNELKDEFESVCSDVSILILQGKKLEEVLQTFLKKHQIETKKIPNSDTEFYFQLNKNTYCAVEVKSFEKNKIGGEHPFFQLGKWKYDLEKYLKTEFETEFNHDKPNIICLLIVNNGFSLHPENRKLSISENIKNRFSDFKVITTINLLKILNFSEGNKKFFEKILCSKEMEIKFDEH